MRTTRLLPLFAAAMLASGCASTVRVRTEPAKGAMIYYRGEGRPTFRWKPAPTTSPASFKVYYSAISAWAWWPATGEQSDVVYVPLSNWGDPDEVVLRPNPALPRVAPGGEPAPAR